MRTSVRYKLLLIADESDDEDGRPARKRRMAEKAAEGLADEDEEVRTFPTLSFHDGVPCLCKFWENDLLFSRPWIWRRMKKY